MINFGIDKPKDYQTVPPDEPQPPSEFELIWEEIHVGDVIIIVDPIKSTHKLCSVTWKKGKGTNVGNKVGDIEYKPENEKNNIYLNNVKGSFLDRLADGTVCPLSVFARTDRLNKVHEFIRIHNIDI